MVQGRGFKTFSLLWEGFLFRGTTLVWRENCKAIFPPLFTAITGLPAGFYSVRKLQNNFYTFLSKTPR